MDCSENLDENQFGNVLTIDLLIEIFGNFNKFLLEMSDLSGTNFQ